MSVRPSGGTIRYFLRSFLNKVVHEISVKQKADHVAYDALRKHGHHGKGDERDV